MSFLTTRGSKTGHAFLLAAALVCAWWPAPRIAHAAIPEVSESAMEAWPPIERPLDQPVVGERIHFHGRWFGLPVGYGWIEVKERLQIRGRTAYHVQAEGRSNALLSTFYPVHDVLHSYFDAETFRPLRFEKYQREGRYRAAEVVTFDYDRGIATYESLYNGSVKEIPITPDIHDIISVFYWLRARPIEPRQSIAARIYSDERIYETEIKPHRPVTLELLKRGSFPCLVFEPLAAFKGVFVRRGRIWVYVTSDARRLPVLTKITTPWGPITGIVDQHSLDPAGAAEADMKPLAADGEAGKDHERAANSR